MTSSRPITAARRRCITLVIGMTAAFASLQAQNAPAAASTPAPTAAQLTRYDLNKNGRLDPDELAKMQAEESAKSSDAVMLTPFEVQTQKDRGYAAGNTLSGSRVDTPLKITANSISVMTKEFLDDFAITDLNQAAAFTIGMDPPTGGANDPFGGGRFQTSFRGGDSGANFPTRDGSLQYFVADSFNSERFEISRGPSTALFGDGGPGGIQGSQSKRALLNRRVQDASFRVDSFGGYRGTVDINVAGSDRFGVRVNALHQNTKSWIEAEGNKQNAIQVATTFKISNNTELRTNFERSAETLTQIRRYYSDQQSLWNRTTFNENNTTIANPATFGLGQISANQDRLIYNFGTGKVYNYRGNQYQTIGLGYAIPWGGRADVPNFPGLDKEFFLGPADALADRDLNARAIYLDHRFTPNWFIQIAHIGSDGDVQQQNLPGGALPGDRRIDVNRLLPDGTPNPNVGKLYSDSGTPQLQYQQDTVREHRLTSTYRFFVPSWFDMKQAFNLNSGWRRGTFEQVAKEWRWANNPAQPDLTQGPNEVRYRVYYDKPRPDVSPLVPPSMPGYTFRLIPIGNGSQARRSRTITYAQLFSQTTFWNDKISISGSIRRDKAVLNGIEGINILPANDYVPTLGTNGVAGARRIRNEWFTTKTAGIVVYPFAERFKALAPIGFIANYSSNFQQIPNNSNGLLGGALAPIPQALTKDWGLRYSLGEGKAYVTLTHYQTLRTGVDAGFGSQAQLRTIYTNLGYTQDLPNGAGPSSSSFNFRDPQDQRLEGWEAEVTANPTPNFTLLANYSHPIVMTIKDSESRRAFLAANQAEFQAGANASPGQVINGRTIGDPVAIQTALQQINDSFNGITNGTLNNGLERHRASVSARYRFTEGSLRGVGINGGVVYRGHRKIGSRDARLAFQTTAPTTQQTAQAAYDYLWTDPITTATAGIHYTRRFGKVNARFQINVENLFNNQDIQWNGYSTIQAGQLQGLNTTTAIQNALTVPGGNPRMQVRTASANNTQLDPRKFIFTTSLSF